MVQLMGVKGYIPGWKADLNAVADAQTRSGWRRLSGIDVPADLTLRGDILRYMYEKMFK